MDKIYIKKYILSYQDIYSLLNEYCNNPKYKYRIKKEINKNYTIFKYPLSSYIIGSGKKHVILFSNTHGCEIITSLFILEFISTLILNDDIYNYYCLNYTFHFIPLVNPEGFIIASSQVSFNVKNLNDNSLEDISKLYLDAYNLDDQLSKKHVKYEKLYKAILKTSCKLIKNKNMIKSINNILTNCNLTSKILPVWSANGVGIDPNSNSIHKFCEIKKLRNNWKYAKLRYNDIPVTCPSPISYPGLYPLDRCCPENIFLYNYIMSNYFNLPKIDENLIAIFSYHSTGGEIYGYPDRNITSNYNISNHENAMDIYSKITGYTKIDEKLKYGVMDFYRAYLNNTVSLTIELSKLNGNPIGPFSNLSSLSKEFIDNKIAILNVIDNL